MRQNRFPTYNVNVFEVARFFVKASVGLLAALWVFGVGSSIAQLEERVDLLEEVVLKLVKLQVPEAYNQGPGRLL